MTLDDRFYSIGLHARVYADKGNDVIIRHASSVLTGMALCDPEEWLPEFAAWALRECVWFDRAFGGLRALHVAFNEWCVRNHSVPCTRYVFEQLLSREGFRASDALVSALVLRKDLEVLMHD